MSIARVNPAAATQIPEPPVARFLFADTRMAWFWLIIRLYVGYAWFTAGWEKMTGYTINITNFWQPVNGGAWIFGAHDGAPILGFVKGALAQTGGVRRYRAGTQVFSRT